MFIGYVFSDEANGIGVILNKKTTKNEIEQGGVRTGAARRSMDYKT